MTPKITMTDRPEAAMRRAIEGWNVLCPYVCATPKRKLSGAEARGFYERLGYAAFGLIEDYPPGHSRIFLKKAPAETRA